jgi:hypothetical protein
VYVYVQTERERSHFPDGYDIAGSSHSTGEAEQGGETGSGECIADQASVQSETPTGLQTRPRAGTEE